MENNMKKEMDYFKQWNELARLNVGDSVKLEDGSTAEFVKLKRKKFIGIIDGTTYDIPVEMFVEIVSRAGKNDGYKKLSPGEAFYINKGGNALLFIFDSIEPGLIIGINPITKSRTKISESMYAGKVGDL